LRRAARVACAPATYPCWFGFKCRIGLRAYGDVVSAFQHADSGQCGTITQKDSGSVPLRRSVASKCAASRWMNDASNGGLA
jgi:hypothetical protein